MSTGIDRQHVVALELDEAYTVVGLRGQTVGEVQRIVVDLAQGNIIGCEIRTDWQCMKLTWDRLAFNAQDQLFEIKQ